MLLTTRDVALKDSEREVKEGDADENEVKDEGKVTLPEEPEAATDCKDTTLDINNKNAVAVIPLTDVRLTDDELNEKGGGKE